MVTTMEAYSPFCKLLEQLAPAVRENGSLALAKHGGSPGERQSGGEAEREHLARLDRERFNQAAQGRGPAGTPAE